MKLKKPIIILGGGGHASVVRELVELNEGKIKGYTDVKDTGLSAHYIGRDDMIERFKPSQVQLVMGIGSVGLPLLRQKMFDHFKSLGYSFATLVHPKAIVSQAVELAEGCQVMAGAVLNPYVRIGKNVIVNTSASIDHDCHINEHTHIAPGVRLSGGVTIGRCCLVGIGGIVIQGVRIGDRVVVAAGAVVIKDVSSAQKVAGIPAKIIK
jgi:sugar O-acyltransferase (sialic acid O-acetyltransferase NeuD family)